MSCNDIIVLLADNTFRCLLWTLFEFNFLDNFDASGLNRDDDADDAEIILLESKLIDKNDTELVKSNGNDVAVDVVEDDAKWLNEPNWNGGGGGGGGGDDDDDDDDDDSDNDVAKVVEPSWNDGDDKGGT